MGQFKCSGDCEYGAYCTWHKFGLERKVKQLAFFLALTLGLTITGIAIAQLTHSSVPLMKILGKFAPQVSGAAAAVAAIVTFVVFNTNTKNHPGRVTQMPSGVPVIERLDERGYIVRTDPVTGEKVADDELCYNGL
ncbi:MAG: hypothetical protein ACKVOH_07145 [Chlamydiales bacterium]